MINREDVWRDIDFRPAPAGWRVISTSDEAPGWYAVPLAGWLIQERARVDRHGDGDYRTDLETPAEDRDRRVCAAVHEVDMGAQPFEVDLAGDFWHVLGPGDPDPTTEDATRARAEQESIRQIRRERREQAAAT